MISITTKIQRRGDADKVLRQLRAALEGAQTVNVGLIDAPPAVMEVAQRLHEGAGADNPPRPFISTAMFDGRSALKAQLRAQGRAILAGDETLADALPKLGEAAQQMIRDRIAAEKVADSLAIAAVVTWKIEP
ncbi:MULTISPECIES: hypothetical protein [unclassified Beijerinckia]|uniref:hypothetical protein n=1 Tax=unclassified Beijerinckia TaxID=2638183 RepID=UPI00089B9FBF|nr:MULTISPECIES: hypothetical protein [unclassified Beijerinckia]MDH7794115.1 hypothetical protein [Beijerinckia sp. GAS462]SEB53635.1 hypothetical protein SAMN05443249_0381 [Beijerinckia sp. 28-YEA-48]